MPEALAGGARPLVSWLWHGPALAMSAALVFMVRIYQKCVRPLLPPSCIYEPGCSEYFIGSVRKYGPVLGSAKGVWRICRCHPWGRGGYDPP